MAESKDSIITHVWGPTKVYAYYIPKESQLSSKWNPIEIMDIGKYGGRVELEAYHPGNIRNLIMEQFSRPGLSIIIVSSRKQAPYHPNFIEELKEALKGKSSISLRCGNEFLYNMLQYDGRDDDDDYNALFRGTSPRLNYMDPDCRKLASMIQASRDQRIPASRIFIFSQGQGRDLSDTCAMLMPVTFRNVPTFEVASPETNWKQEDGKAAGSLARKIERELTADHKHRTVVFAHRSPQAAMKRKALESKVHQEVRIKDDTYTKFISLIIPQMNPDQPPFSWMDMMYEVLNLIKIRSASVFLVAELSSVDAATIGVMSDLRGNLFYHVGEDSKLQFCPSQYNLKCISYPTESEVLGKLRAFEND
ncbi:hypothetical protein Pmar_PMAR000937 [Perkinsus marinus ATCC 50983]|uniref:Uncharacterized protein n=1 Tax=Perkinsus marinus (strain ATCC 50983 / TXsc) TaxID=423536 RepID=C5KNY9_PERM5|nr:hypothetical protein Pmar_PMAR000937 [Perkinsus marinus ATCC 50983]EER13777.1 hypothetical protein Pmar_PMAR000937 [Perkinsus marinus ATCC 50983]|eukprot:XP_002781982.1 hypothetical protein Pmar_PMAR000937 [Perkinsus marinus ATCC 50983]